MTSPPSSSQAPITPDILSRLLTVLQSIHLSVREQTLFCAMFLLAFYGFLRVGEMFSSWHCLQLAYLQLQSAFLSLTFNSFKFSTMQAPSVFIPSSPRHICPVVVMHDYLSFRGMPPGPLFLDEDGLPIQSRSFGAILHETCAATNLSDHCFIPHRCCDRGCGHWNP